MLDYRITYNFEDGIPSGKLRMMNNLTMERKYVYVLVWALIALAISVPVCGKENYSLSRLGVERGLSNNHVVGIVQDKQGFIWIATDEGLNRFDGHNFRTFFKDEPTSRGGITGNELNCIIDDPERPIIWIGTARAGLDAYDYNTDTFTSYRHDEKDGSSLITDDVTYITPAADGGIWVSTFWRGVDHFNPATGEFTHYNSQTVDGMPDASVWSMADGGDGFLYVGHEHHGLTVIDLKHRTACNYMPDPGKPDAIPSANLSCVYKDSMSNIWIGSAAGLSLYNREDNSFINFSKYHPALRHTVSDIRQFDDNRLWVAMERGGLASLGLGDSIFSSPVMADVRSIPSGKGEGMLSSPSVRCIFQDKFSNIWAGTWGGGINLITGIVPAFRLHASSPEPYGAGVNSESSVFTFLFDDNHRLWVGRDRGGLEVYFNGELEKSYTPMQGALPGDIAQSSWKSPDGILWFGFFNAGASCFDPVTGKFVSVFPYGSRVDVRDITGMAGGKIIMGTSQGLWEYDQTGKTLDGPFAVGNNLVRKVFPLPSGRLLVGTFGSGLVMTDSKYKELWHLDVAGGLPSNTVNDIFRSRDGSIWVATGEGLLQFPDIDGAHERFRIYNKTSGLGNSHVAAIVQDRGGNIWLSTNGGISCLTGDKILNYSHRDHIPLGNFLPHSSGADQQGNIYMGNISGLCVFNPVKVLEKLPAPPAVVTELTVMNPSGNSHGSPDVIQLSGKGEVRLNPGQNNFDVSFTTSNFAIARESEYAYMLDGFDSDWIMARNGNTATFRDIRPGKYVFKVKTRLRNQEWGEPAEIKIVIPPPFWKSWWANVFYILFALCIVGTLHYFYRKRVNAEALLKAEKERHLKEVELNDERLRFYTNITHELRTPLTLIVGPLEDLAKSGRLPEKEHKSVEMIHRNAGRLLDLVNRILEFRKTETQNRKLCVRYGNIAATVYEVALKYKELNRNQNVKVNVATQSGDMEMCYDKEVMTIILDNLISNAMKYTNEGSVDVDCRRDGEDIIITVTDTGVGISSSALEHVFNRYYQERGPHQAAGTGIGLALVKNLVTLHHGRIDVESEEGHGTKFTVVIPADGSYPEALHTEEERKQTDEPRESETSEPIGGDRKPLVLVVEDNADIRDYIKQSFTDLYDVRCAENGEEGLRLAFEIMPSIIVSDIMMPVMDGVEMTRKLKEDVRTSHIPVILLTAKTSETDREEGYGSGADSYLIKPFSSTLLQTRINNLLMQRMKLTETYASRPAPAPDDDGNSLEQKRKRLMKGLSEVDREFIDKLTKIITDNVPSETVDVNFVAVSMGMSTSTLYRKVKAVTGISPNEYIRKVKMQMAENLLLDGHYTLSEIAYKVGINSLHYFRQCFKDEFGMTPSDYLRRLTDGDESDECTPPSPPQIVGMRGE